MDYPQLRAIEALPADVSGERVFVLRDPSGISESLLTVSPPLLYLLQFFDGRHSLTDLQAEFSRRFGEILVSEKIKEVIALLNEHHFLDNDDFVAFFKKIRDDFGRADTRLPYHAGKAYPESVEAINREFEKFYAALTPQDGLPEGAPRALVAPHIDIAAGGSCFAAAYQALNPKTEFETIVILGTGHQPIPGCFAATRKDFVTPLGRVKTDRDFIAALDQALKRDCAAEEFFHRTEHTIEFQTVFLQHRLGPEARFTIVPLLCSFSPLMLNSDLFPEEAEAIQKFIAAFREVVASYPGRILLVASADLAHIGVRYGDREPCSPAFLEAVRREDRELLACLTRMDLEGFCRSVLKDQDARRICGFPPIYTMMNALSANEGVLLKYDEAQVDDHNSTVTFAGMAFY